MAGHQAASEQVSVNSTLLLCNAYYFRSSNVWVRQHHSVLAFDMSTGIDFVYLGLQFKWNQFSSVNSRHTSCIQNGLHAGKWPDLLTSKQDAVSTLRYGWKYYTWTTLADAITQWYYSGNPELICTIGTHQKTTALPLSQCTIAGPVCTVMPLECHWLTQCTLGYHWVTQHMRAGYTGTPLKKT